MPVVKDGCPFCEIVAAGGRPIVAANRFAVAFPTNQPRASKHLLVVPKDHVVDWRHGPDGWSIVAMWNLVSEVSADWPSLKVVCNNGPGAGQTVAHLHLHVRSR